MNKDIRPLITIITATYNAEKTIEQTISSVLSQDYNNIEYIIIDGKSCDGTLDKISKYKEDRRLKVISEPDNGLYDALNKGVKIATGDYIEIIGADDALADSHVVSTVVDELEDDIDIFSGMEYGVDEKTCRQCFICDNHVARDKMKYKGGMIGHAAMFVKKELLEKYPFDLSYRIAADYKFFLQCYYDNKVKFQFSDTLIAYFSRSGMSSDAETCEKENLRLYEELKLDFYNSKGKDCKSKIKMYLKKILSQSKKGNFLIDCYRLLLYYIKSSIIWEKHRCNNKICRWCGKR